MCVWQANGTLQLIGRLFFACSDGETNIYGLFGMVVWGRSCDILRILMMTGQKQWPIFKAALFIFGLNSNCLIFLRAFVEDKIF